ncbi:UPF0158 family protein [Virgibacillus dokdonensis]|uniref:UPF0158 family protein n=1 Tax=Virgibacillus dokdonensis TaxID=302167 RepID=UPI00098AE949|nr:UPF0158 family protein [Virgibacillus dokdonensis]
MSQALKLSDLIDEMDMQSDDSNGFVNKKTGEIVYIMREFLSMAEDGEKGDHLPSWEQKQLKLAEDIVFSFEKYQTIPSKYDMNEYDIMEDFCLAVKNERHQQQLLTAIRGKGAFRRFKDKIIALDLEDDWYDYHHNRLKEIAIDFCHRHEIKYEDK